MSEWSGANRRGFVKMAAAAAAGALSGTLGSPASQSAARTMGKWSPIYPWPDCAIHLHLLPDGKILSYSDDHTPERFADYTEAFVVTIPYGRPPSPDYVKVPNTTTNLFCGGHVFLPDGRLFVAGGHEGKDGLGSKDVNIFEYAPAYAWRRQDMFPMNGGRWYPSLVVLSNGDIVTMSGHVTPTRINPIAEVWQSKTGGWRRLTTAKLFVPLYPNAHLAPDGRVFVAGPDTRTRYLDTASTGTWTNVGHRYYGMWRDYSSSVMYEDGKVLIVGGSIPPTNTAEIIELNADAPVWRPTASMAFARRHLYATMLPDGKVLVTGGTSSPGFNDGTAAVLDAEIWDPATERWTTMAKMQVKRCYHSTAMLLPDGRVLSAGGGRPSGINLTDNANVEIFSPPYLFNGSRPVINSAPSELSYGQNPFEVSVSTTGVISQVTLLGLGSVTHGANMNQRFQRLTFEKTIDGVLVNAPFNRNLLPPGFYMLFVIDEAGSPSVATMIRIHE